MRMRGEVSEEVQKFPEGCGYAIEAACFSVTDVFNGSPAR